MADIMSPEEQERVAVADVDTGSILRITRTDARTFGHLWPHVRALRRKEGAGQMPGHPKARSAVRSVQTKAKRLFPPHTLCSQLPPGSVFGKMRSR